MWVDTGLVLVETRSAQWVTLKKDGMWNMYLCVQTAYYLTRARPQGSKTFSECLALKWLPQMTLHTNTLTDQSELNALMFADTPKLAKNSFYKGNVLTGCKGER